MYPVRVRPSVSVASLAIRGLMTCLFAPVEDVPARSEMLSCDWL